MAGADLILFEEEYQQIHAAISRLRREANALSVVMIEKSGQAIASVGDMADIDPTALSSLTAGNVAATEGLAQLIGENQFNSLFHEGERQNIHISLVGGRVILLVVFDQDSSLGLVRLRVRKVSTELAGILETVNNKSAAGVTMGAASDGPFSDITDEDIDKLFAD
jgi:predicted regulator of Ras-like GTPase activity (Roadblock/LC7/MglB family)